MIDKVCSYGPFHKAFGMENIQYFLHCKQSAQYTLMQQSPFSLRWVVAKSDVWRFLFVCLYRSLKFRSTIFQSCWDRAMLSGELMGLAQGHYMVPPVGIEPRTS